MDKTAYDKARDSLYTLPLSGIPFKTKGLKSCLLVKNPRLETMIQVFDADKAGKGQVTPLNIEKFVDIKPENLEHDRNIIQKLSELTSFDVYSLRIGLRRVGINVDDDNILQLSDNKRDALSRDVLPFLYPLIEKIFGDDKERISSFQDLIRLLNTPDKKEALENLKRLARELQVPLSEIPMFLQDFGDMYLSIAYYEDALQTLLPSLREFLDWCSEEERHHKSKLDEAFMKQLSLAHDDFLYLITSLETCLTDFKSRFLVFWSEANPQTYIMLKEDLNNAFASVGSVLCGLEVKAQSLQKGMKKGTNSDKMEFFRTEIFPGMSRLKDYHP